MAVGILLRPLCVVFVKCLMCVCFISAAAASCVVHHPWLSAVLTVVGPFAVDPFDNSGDDSLTELMDVQGSSGLGQLAPHSRFWLGCRSKFWLRLTLAILVCYVFVVS